MTVKGRGMKVVGQDEQLKVMENMAAQCWPVSYEQTRELMFAFFNAEYGRDNWTHAAIDEEKKVAFEKWLSEDDA
jgi:hypothetical protein